MDLAKLAGLPLDGDEAAQVFEAYAFEFHLGRIKAGETLRRHQSGPADVEAWRKVRPAMLARKFIWAIQQFKNPMAFAENQRSMQEEEKLPDRGKTQEERLERVEARRRWEPKGGVPPPPEFHAMVKKLREKWSG